MGNMFQCGLGTSLTPKKYVCRQLKRLKHLKPIKQVHQFYSDMAGFSRPGTSLRTGQAAADVPTQCGPSCAGDGSRARAPWMRAVHSQNPEKTRAQTVIHPSNRRPWVFCPNSSMYARRIHRHTMTYIIHTCIDIYCTRIYVYIYIYIYIYINIYIYIFEYV